PAILCGHAPGGAPLGCARRSQDQVPSMASVASAAPSNRRAVAAVYGAGLLQGLALVTFPAASAVFTSRAAYDLTSAEYGAMFVPQTVLAIAAALLGGRIQRRWGEKR